MSTPTLTKTIDAEAPQPGAVPTPITQADPKVSSDPAPPQPGAVPIADSGVEPAAHTPAPTATTQPTPTTTEKSSEEAQNALTKEFTEAEWTALKEFRGKLPTVLADSITDLPEPKPTNIHLWGISIDPSNATKDARVSVVLMKFLRAQNLNVMEAQAMLTKTLRWRTEFGVEAAMKEKYPEEVFGKLGKIYGQDKEKRPVVWNLYGEGDQKEVFGDVQRFLRWRVALMEESITLLNFETVDQAVQVHDYEGVSFTSRDPGSKAAASEATKIFSDHYPELLYRKFFINIPTIFNWMFWLFKPLISAKTLSKMSVVGTGQSTIKKALEPVIDVKELPERYGGEGKDF